MFQWTILALKRSYTDKTPLALSNDSAVTSRSYAALRGSRILQETETSIVTRRGKRHGTCQVRHNRGMTYYKMGQNYRKEDTADYILKT